MATENNPADLPPAPEPFFRLSNGTELKMTYGFLNRLAKLVGGVENIGLILVDMGVQEVILITALSTYDKKGQLVEQANVEEIELMPEEILSLLSWITGHITHFFLKNLLSGGTMAGQFQKMVELSSKSSPNGSQG